MQENEAKNKAIDKQLEARLVTWGQAADDAAGRAGRGNTPAVL